MIKEQFGKYSEKINGIEFAIRFRSYKFMIWISERDDQCISILETEIKKVTDSFFQTTFTFDEHESALKLKVKGTVDG